MHSSTSAADVILPRAVSIQKPASSFASGSAFHGLAANRREDNLCGMSRLS